MLRRGGAWVAVALGAAAAVATLAGAPRSARADGAFPDGFNPMTPEGWPDRFVVATNFGVVFSQDGGATWRWTCEQDANSYGFLYQMGLPPRARVFNVAHDHVIYSDDDTCTWQLAAGPIASGVVKDLWLDRAVPDRAFAVATTGDADVVYESSDDGATFAKVLYTGEPGQLITGVEDARANPDVVYLTLWSNDGTSGAPRMARSTDGGATWTVSSLQESLGPGEVRLMGVDAQDADKLFLLYRDAANVQHVAVSTDGGKTAAVHEPAPNARRVFTAFLQTSAGVILVASDIDSAGGLLRSTDGGMTFVDLPDPPHVRGLSERAGVVYATTNFVADGYALGASLDGGLTWSAFMSFSDVTAIPACVQPSCQAACEELTQLVQWPEATCTMPVQPPPGTDGGLGGATGADAGPDDASGAGAGPGSRSSGCACTEVTGTTPLGAGALLAVALAWLALAARRRG